MKPAKRDNMRRAFESWAKRRWTCLGRLRYTRDDGSPLDVYEVHIIQAAWEAWQAATRRATERASDREEAGP